MEVGALPALVLVSGETPGPTLSIVAATGRDAVLSSGAAKLLTSVHRHELACWIRDSPAGRETLTTELPGIDPAELIHLGDDGVVLVGTTVHPGMVIVGKMYVPASAESAPYNNSLRVPPGVHGVVDETRLREGTAVVSVVCKRALAVGDLLRAGDDALATVGAIVETLPSGVDAEWPGVSGTLAVSKIRCAEDVLGARAIGPYSLVTQQPLGGKNALGGQRIGAAHLRALLARGAVHVVHEMLTVKSDDVDGRTRLFAYITRGRPKCVPSMPAAARVLESELRALAFDVAFEVEDHVAIGLASSEKVRAWAPGEVKLPDTLHERTHAPGPGGLFCYDVFGPRESAERRTRLGRIELPFPILHPWAVTHAARLLDVTPERVTEVLYDERTLTGAEPTSLADAGAEALRGALRAVDLEDVARGEGSRADLARAMRSAGVRAEQLVYDAWPVLPPDLRPIVPLDDGRWATSDLNDLYRTLINRANRIRRLLEIQGPEEIIRVERIELQRAVDVVVHNGLRGRLLEIAGRRLRSLVDLVGGPQGRFATGVQGKRVDYSAIATVVAVRDLAIERVLVPRDAALELWKPWLYHSLEAAGHVHEIRDGRTLVETRDPRALTALDAVVREHPILVFPERIDGDDRAIDVRALDVALWDAPAVGLAPALIASLALEDPGANVTLHVPADPRAVSEARTRLRAPPPLGTPIDLARGAGWFARAARATTDELGPLLFEAALRREIDPVRDLAPRMILGRPLGD